MARALSRILLAPAAAELKAPRLLIAADGALQYVPFAALPDPRAVAEEQPLILRHEIVSLPSASALAILRRSRSGRRAPPHQVAVLAAPVFQADDPRILSRSRLVSVTHSTEDLPPLPWSQLEAQAILSLVPPEESLAALGFKANLETATSPELGRYRIIHFATHGQLSDRPELSRLVLSQFDSQGRKQQGSLYAFDIYNLDLPVDLVVLSACQTGLGDDVRGEGIGRMTRGFLYAGAKSVVVSLWSVSDRATAELMEGFYRQMLQEGRSPAAALRAAQIAMLRQRGEDSAYYWAGFVFQGDWK